MTARLRWAAVYLLSYLIGVTVWLYLWSAVPVGGDRPWPGGLRIIADNAHRHANLRGRL